MFLLIPCALAILMFANTSAIPSLGNKGITAILTIHPLWVLGMWPRIVHFCDGKKDICFQRNDGKISDYGINRIKNQRNVGCALRGLQASVAQCRPGKRSATRQERRRVCLLQRQQRKARQPVPAAIVAADHMPDTCGQMFRHRLAQCRLRRVAGRKRFRYVLHTPRAAEV
ncbi:Uncharacterised protein [Enterobacter cloacae]|nr:Uncharacterised protein [Enterobacter cloacae]